MPRISGKYSLPATYKAIPGEIIRTENHNPPLEDMAQALTDSIPRDGTAGMTGNLPMGGNKITNLAAAVVDTDAVRRGQVTTIWANAANLDTLNTSPNQSTYDTALGSVGGPGPDRGIVVTQRGPNGAWAQTFVSTLGGVRGMWIREYTAGQWSAWEALFTTADAVALVDDLDQKYADTMPTKSIGVCTLRFTGTGTAFAPTFPAGDSVNRYAWTLRDDICHLDVFLSNFGGNFANIEAARTFEIVCPDAPLASPFYSGVGVVGDESGINEFAGHSPGALIAASTNVIKLLRIPADGTEILGMTAASFSATGNTLRLSFSYRV